MKIIKKTVYIAVVFFVICAFAIGNSKKVEAAPSVISPNMNMQDGAGDFNKDGGAMRGDPDIQKPGDNVSGDKTDGMAGDLTEEIGDIIDGNDTAGNGDGNDANTENNAPNGVITEGDKNPDSTKTAPSTDSDMTDGMTEGGVNWVAVICWVLIGLAVVAVIIVFIPKKRDR